MILKKKFCIDELPDTCGNYDESVDLLFYTIFGSYVVGTFRRNMWNIGMFYPSGESRPYRVNECVHWSVLPRDGELGGDLENRISEK